MHDVAVGVSPEVRTLRVFGVGDKAGETPTQEKESVTCCKKGRIMEEGKNGCHGTEESEKRERHV